MKKTNGNGDTFLKITNREVYNKVENIENLLNQNALALKELTLTLKGIIKSNEEEHTNLCNDLSKQQRLIYGAYGAIVTAAILFAGWMFSHLSNR